LRAAVIRRSRGQCEVPGCTSPGAVVDHVVSRRRGGTDELGNLRHLCRRHDNEIKEDATGARRGDGKLSGPRGCDAAGIPIDPNHGWHR
jgi:5-methylcytosine-specific restriction endonuclease McrA